MVPEDFCRIASDDIKKVGVGEYEVSCHCDGKCPYFRFVQTLIGPNHFHYKEMADASSENRKYEEAVEALVAGQQVQAQASGGDDEDGVSGTEGWSGDGRFVEGTRT